MDSLISAIEGAVAAEPEVEVSPNPTQPGDVAIESKLSDEIRTPAQTDDAAVETELTEEAKANYAEWEPARQDEDVTAENQLTAEISELWSQHTQLSGTRRATAKELRLLRARLAEKLHEMKSLLARPGRAGQWRSWLRQQHIPRSTADRLAARYAETLNAEDNVLSEAINEKEDTIEELVQSLLPRLRRTLADTQAVFLFIAAVGEALDLHSYTCADCVCVFLPGSEWDDPPDEESTEDINSEQATSSNAVGT